MPYDPNANFPGDEYPTWGITLTGDCTPTFTNLVGGNLYTIIIVQPGGYAFNWPDNVRNATQVLTDEGVFIQTFVAGEDETLFAIAPATYYP